MVTSWLRRDAHGAKTSKALEPRNVLVVLSGHAMDEDLVRMACTLAKNGKGHVIAINVVEVPRSLPLDAVVGGVQRITWSTGPLVWPEISPCPSRRRWSRPVTPAPPSSMRPTIASAG